MNKQKILVNCFVFQFILTFALLSFSFQSVAVAVTKTGLDFPSNLTPNADIRLVWAGSNLLPRTSHTAIWTVRYVQQTGYYAVTWHTSNDRKWHGSNYDFGVHPHPCDGTYLSNGQRARGTFDAGTVQYQEIAGLGTDDYIQGPGAPFKLIYDGRWLVQARQSWVVGNTVYHREYPDVLNNPGSYVEKTRTLAQYNAAAALAVKPSFMFGSSPWTIKSGHTNNECLSGVLRGIRLFTNGTMSIADIAAEAVANNNTPATTAGAASVWYINDNPTPTDITDKSDAGHTPVWDNARRPRLYSATVDPSPPVITISSLPSGVKGTAYSKTISVTGGKLPLTWAVVSGSLPTGLSLNASSGKISGTPTSAGIFNCTVRVTDNDNRKDDQAFSIEIFLPAPQIITTSLLNGNVNQSYSQTLQASGGKLPLSWSIISGGLPAGLSLAVSTGQITGTPTTGGTSNFTARVTDNISRYNNQVLSIYISAPTTPPQITTTWLQGGLVGQAYSQTLQAQGGTLPLSWTIVSGNLPAGVSFNRTSGAISGTPTASAKFNFTLRVTDNQARTDDQSLYINVLYPAPVITTTTLPNAIMNQAYSCIVQSTGGTPLLLWSISLGTLPAGLSLAPGTGEISATPTVIGTSNFTVTLTDDDNRTNDHQLSITVDKEATGPPMIYRSVGPNNRGDLNADSRVMEISGTRAVFSGSMPDNMGVGDVLVYGSNLAFISGRNSSIQYTVQAVNGTTPSPAPSGTNVKVYRAYTSLYNAEAGTENPSVGSNFDAWTGGHDLVSQNIIWQIACYGDNVDNTAVTIDGWNTKSENYLRVFAPISSNQVGTSQRHDGIWDNNRYCIEVTYSNAITINDEHTKIEGLQVRNAGTSAFRAINNSASSNNSYISHCVIQSNGNTNWNNMGVCYSGNNKTHYLFNNIITGCYRGVSFYYNQNSTFYVYNNTVVDCNYGFLNSFSTTNAILMNNIAQNCNMGYRNVSAVISDYNISDISGDAPNAAFGGGYSDVIFEDEGAGDFRLSGSDTTARDQGVDLSSCPNLYFADDIAGNLRDANWDIGASETNRGMAPDPNIATTSLLDGIAGTPYSQILTVTGGTSPPVWTIVSGSLPADLSLSASTGQIAGTPTASGTSNFKVRVTDYIGRYDNLVL